LIYITVLPMQGEGASTWGNQSASGSEEPVRSGLRSLKLRWLMLGDKVARSDTQPNNNVLVPDMYPDRCQIAPKRNRPRRVRIHCAPLSKPVNAMRQPKRKHHAGWVKPRSVLPQIHLHMRCPRRFHPAERSFLLQRKAPFERLERFVVPFEASNSLPVVHAVFLKIWLREFHPLCKTLAWQSLSNSQNRFFILKNGS
jgi:hypothetical protein